MEYRHDTIIVFAKDIPLNKSKEDVLKEKLEEKYGGAAELFVSLKSPRDGKPYFVERWLDGYAVIFDVAIPEYKAVCLSKELQDKLTKEGVLPAIAGVLKDEVCRHCGTKVGEKRLK